jgi:hypothetical protein
VTATETEVGLAEATRRITALREERAALTRAYEKEATRLDAEVFDATYRRNLVLAGAPLPSIELAEEVLQVVKPENVGIGEGRAVVIAAIEDVAQGAPKLRGGYFGTKNYDSWRGQREDGQYNSGPRHGTTIFAVGLQPAFRQRYDEKNRKYVVDRELTPAEMDAAISYLHALLGTLARP